MAKADTRKYRFASRICCNEAWWGNNASMRRSGISRLAAKSCASFSASRNCAIDFREHGLMHEQVSDFVGYVKANAFRCLVRINRNVGNAIEDETERVHFPAHVRHTECANTVRLRQIQHAGQRILPIAPFIAKHGRALFRRDGLFRTVRQIIVRQHEVIGDPVEEQQRIAAMADGGLALSCRGFAQRTKPYPISRQILNGGISGQSGEKRRIHSQNVGKRAGFAQRGAFLLVIRDSTRCYAE